MCGSNLLPLFLWRWLALDGEVLPDREGCTLCNLVDRLCFQSSVRWTVSGGYKGSFIDGLRDSKYDLHHTFFFHCNPVKVMIMISTRYASSYWPWVIVGAIFFVFYYVSQHHDYLPEGLHIGGVGNPSFHSIVPLTVAAFDGPILSTACMTIRGSRPPEPRPLRSCTGRRAIRFLGSFLVWLLPVHLHPCPLVRLLPRHRPRG